MQSFNGKIESGRSDASNIAPTLTDSNIRGIEMAQNSLPKKRRGGKKPYIQTESDFWALVAVTNDPEDCWLWQGKSGHYGYGCANFAGERIAHRVSFALANGKRADNWVLHKCDNPPCVNPNHLYDGTPKDNARDRESRGRGGAHKIAAKTHCRRGHERSPDNLYVHRGSKMCRQCLAITKQEFKQRRQPTSAWVDATDTNAKVNHLLSLGIAKSAICAALGWSSKTKALRIGKTHVFQKMHDGIARVYEAFLKEAA